MITSTQITNNEIWAIFIAKIIAILVFKLLNHKAFLEKTIETVKK